MAKTQGDWAREAKLDRLRLVHPSRPEYRMYVDEVGSVDLGAAADPNNRYLSLTGTILSLEVARTQLAPAFERLKREYLEPDPAKMVIFHRSEMVRRTGPFRPLQQEAIREAFDRDLFTVLEVTPFVVITVTIDKHALLAKYGTRANHPYHYCMECLLERYVLWLDDASINGRGDVMAEARGKKEDWALKAAFRGLHASGSSFVGRDRVASRITSCEIKLARKGDNEAGLQLADLVAHPSYRAMKAKRLNEPAKRDFGWRIAALLEASKYRRGPWGGIEGAGRKWLP